MDALAGGGPRPALRRPGRATIATVSEDDAALELLALARLGLAERLANAPAAALEEARARGAAALERHGVLRAHQVRAVRAYVAQHARACACGRRVLAPEGGGATACVGCGADVTASGGVAAPRPPRTIGPGSRVGPLEVLEKLGAGASGTVYRARHVELGRLSALKVIPRATLDARRVRRFQREVEALARLDHPGIVKVHAAYEHEGSLAFDMELVDGETLEARIEREGPLPWREAATIVLHLARAVQHAHDLGVLHRDLKPGNVLVRRDGRVVLADLGLSRLTDQSSSLTLAGAPVGTPCYMAPEAFGGESTVAVDVYGLGTILYEALTGRPPFIAETLPALLHLVTRGQCEPTAAPGAPPDLEAVRACAMAPRPEARYPTAGALADDLERLLAGRATSASSTARAILRAGPPRGLVAAVLALAVVVAGGAAALLISPGAIVAPATDAAPASLEDALDALARGAHLDAALAIVARAAHDDEAVAALDGAIARAPEASALRAARALVRRERAAPLLAADLAAVGSAGAGVALADRLALHALAAGLDGADAERVAAARSLSAGHPTSRAAATLLALEGCRAGDPALHDEVVAALERGLQTDPLARRLASLLRLVEDIRRAIEAEGRALDDGRLLAREVAALAQEPRLAGATRVLLAPLAPVVRARLRHGPLGDVIEGQPRRALLHVLDAAGDDVPDLLLGCGWILRDGDPYHPEPRATARSVARLELAGRALLGDDPHVGLFALQLAHHKRLVALDGDVDAVERGELEALQLADALRESGTSTERLWVARVLQRAWTDLVEVEKRRLARATDPAARRAHQERALRHAQAAMRACDANPVLFARRRYLAEDIARYALPLGLLDDVEAVLPDLRQRESIRAELDRRRGDPEGALRQVGAAARPTPEALAVMALALADLGRLDEAREALERLRAMPDTPFLNELHPLAIERYVAARER